MRTTGGRASASASSPTSGSSLSNDIRRRLATATLHLQDRGRHGFFDEFAADLTPVIEAFLRGPHDEDG
ncbi:hypothetical protein [Actinoplanes sp. NPDC048796]|uniref:hypothetical protein n=1 Tax=unclassified Actinoplanes TaxID=2626549 RepID=UPI0033E08F2B